MGQKHLARQKTVKLFYAANLFSRRRPLPRPPQTDPPPTEWLSAARSRIPKSGPIGNFAAGKVFLGARLSPRAKENLTRVYKLVEVNLITALNYSLFEKAW
jgi:hypothetical protein